MSLTHQSTKPIPENEIVTPEMIEAGRDAMFSYCVDFSAEAGGLADCLEDIYRAMVRSKDQGCGRLIGSVGCAVCGPNAVFHAAICSDWNALDCRCGFSPSDSCREAAQSRSLPLK